MRKKSCQVWHIIWYLGRVLQDRIPKPGNDHFSRNSEAHISKIKMYFSLNFSAKLKPASTFNKIFQFKKMWNLVWVYFLTSWYKKLLQLVFHSLIATRWENVCREFYIGVCILTLKSLFNQRNKNCFEIIKYHFNNSFKCPTNQNFLLALFELLLTV